jgi:hypothetical protein
MSAAGLPLQAAAAPIRISATRAARTFEDFPAGLVAVGSLMLSLLPTY